MSNEQNVNAARLAIINAALTRGADYGTRLVGAYDAVSAPADGGIVKYIVRADSLAKDNTTRVYVNRYTRVGKAGETMETVAQAKGVSVNDARTWLANALAALDKRTDVKARTGKAAAANVAADALDAVLAPAPTAPAPDAAKPADKAAARK